MAGNSYACIGQDAVAKSFVFSMLRFGVDLALGMADEVARNRNTLEQTSARGLKSVPFAFIEAFSH